MKKFVALAAVLAFSLTACGSDETAEAAKKSIAEGMLENADGALPKEDAECFSDKVVDGVGVEQLEEYGVIDSKGKAAEDIQGTKFEEADAEAMADAFVDCIDFTDIIGQMTGGGEPSEEVMTCLEEKISEDDVRELFKAQFMGDEVDESLFAGAEECLTS